MGFEVVKAAGEYGSKGFTVRTFSLEVVGVPLAEIVVQGGGSCSAAAVDIATFGKICKDSAPGFSGTVLDVGDG